jgi:hypothetical protein
MGRLKVTILIGFYVYIFCVFVYVGVCVYGEYVCVCARVLNTSVTPDSQFACNLAQMENK